ncbi:DMT family transporter [Kineothrix sp. MB12-C1]|uniref:DMT family transporter n=1 Tax=Kineothrix sp. MB12-C1 TaxID=3070215 RepID=UPI0027D20722|nr:DMT family transporter [Kineothrix sp. MB12-C1]WMC91979.1 DMT family transporter [Kineothrix sp. MB12-C1]
MKKTAIGSSLLLFLAACIWGFAFVAQSVGMDHMGPLTFNGVRFLIGGIVLLPVIAMRQRKERMVSKPSFPFFLKGGICCGIVICSASIFQQMGIRHTTVGKSGFITTLYIIIVPILGLFFHKKVAGKVWGAAIIALVGLYMLCAGESFSIGKGEALTFVCAILFSVHILLIDYFSPKMDGIVLSCIQFLTAGSICIMGSFLLEQPTWSQLLSGIWPLLYAGVISCGIAYTLQVVAQKHVEPAIASLILSMESSVALLGGWLILGQALSPKELFGCALVFGAVILVQLPSRGKGEVRKWLEVRGEG